MKMTYIGTIECSTTELKSRNSFVIFNGLCYLRCKYCHNYKALTGIPKTIEISELMEQITKAKPIVDAVVFTGGEALIEDEALTEIAKHAKSLDLQVAIETAGTCPKSLATAIKDELVDIVLFDIKFPLYEPNAIDKIEQICGRRSRSFLQDMRSTYEMLLKFEGEKHARSTVYPQAFSLEDIMTMAELAEPFDSFTLQNVRPESSPFPGMKGFSQIELARIAKQVNTKYQKVHRPLYVRC